MERTRLGALLFGMGLTGMLDGIVFHQLLQWHSTYMWTNRMIRSSVMGCYML
ncbi:hypothetical protein GCM10025858_26290 [Alicyclobacillus sacchari]|nr:hypothetical protein GCM10025858_26290 [Alicyclobacillus sacchari]